MQDLNKAVGRLLVGRPPGLALDDDHKAALRAGHLTGYTLFKDNADDLEQLLALNKSVEESSLHPPILSVDQEGGAVQRFDHLLTPLPSPMALGAISDREITRTVTAISTTQLKRLGFNMLLAPTLDLQTNPLNPIICTRAFGEDIELVSKMGEYVIDEIERHGVLAVGKHFPGHGATKEDSHLRLAIVPKTRDELKKTDLVPFVRNLNRLKAILVGHIWLPEIDSEELPASLSTNITQKLLIDELGFSGLVVSDDMIMKAITNEYGLGEACVRAVLAGIDLLLVCGTLSEVKEAHQSICQAVQSGRLKEARLEAAIAKIDRLFSSRCQFLKDDNNKDLSLDQFQAEIIRERKETLAAASAGIVALDKVEPLSGAYTIFRPNHTRYPMPLLANLQKHDKSLVLDELTYSLNPDSEEIDSLLAKTKEKVIFLSYRTAINSRQIELIKALSQAGKEIIQIATDLPYDIIHPQLAGINRKRLASLDPSDLAMEALSLYLTGKTVAQGQLIAGKIKAG